MLEMSKDLFEVIHFMELSTVLPAAFYKSVLHAAKHPFTHVCGVLLASADCPTDIVDAVPLCHLWILAPMMQAALSQVFLLYDGSWKSTVKTIDW